MATTETEASKAFVAAREEQKRFLPQQTDEEILQAFSETKTKVLGFIDQQGLRGTVPFPIDCDYVAERIAIFYARVSKLPILQKLIVTYCSDPNWTRFDVWSVRQYDFYKRHPNEFMSSRIRMKHGGLKEEDRNEVQNHYFDEIARTELAIGWGVVEGTIKGRAPIHEIFVPFESGQKVPNNNELLSELLAQGSFGKDAANHIIILGELVPSHSEFAKPAPTTF